MPFSNTEITHLQKLVGIKSIQACDLLEYLNSNHITILVRSPPPTRSYKALTFFQTLWKVHAPSPTRTTQESVAILSQPKTLFLPPDSIFFDAVAY